MVTLDDEQYEILQSLKGFGKKDAEKIRNILIAYLSENRISKQANRVCLGSSAPAIARSHRCYPTYFSYSGHLEDCFTNHKS